MMTFSHSRYNPQIRLSSEEILEISQEINREFTPVFSTKMVSPTHQQAFSLKEMLEISEEISRDFAPIASNNTQELVLLPVDPDHLYVYWNPAQDKLNDIQKIASGHQLTLRIYTESGTNTNTNKPKPYFDVAINDTQVQQNIVIPVRTHDTAYFATIGNRHHDNNLTPFARSNITHALSGKVMPITAEGSQSVFKPMPSIITASRGSSFYKNNSASGQGDNP
jgi:hypothetical protein